LERQFDAKVDLVEGEKGIFDVVAEDKLIFSKHSVGRFPEDKEIVDALRQL